MTTRLQVGKEWFRPKPNSAPMMYHTCFAHWLPAPHQHTSTNPRALPSGTSPLAVSRRDAACEGAAGPPRFRPGRPPTKLGIPDPEDPPRSWHPARDPPAQSPLQSRRKRPIQRNPARLTRITRASGPTRETWCRPQIGKASTAAPLWSWIRVCCLGVVGPRDWDDVGGGGEEAGAGWSDVSPGLEGSDESSPWHTYEVGSVVWGAVTRLKRDDAALRGLQ